MKNKIIICILGIVSLVLITGCENKEKKVTDSDYLYEEAVNYIINNDDNKDKENERYKLFVNYTSFGITKDEEHRYVYMWINEESYYVEDNKIITSSGSSMPYKFTFDLKENNVIKYEIPRDGNEYVKSIKEMYPNNLEKKAINYKNTDDKITKEVKEYYKDLTDKSIYYYTGEEYIKLDK